MKALFLSHQSTDHLGGAELSMLRIIEEWSQRRSSLEPIVVSPEPEGAMSAACRERGWSTMLIPFEGWAVASIDGGAPERHLRDLAAANATQALIDIIRRERVELVVTNTIVAPWAALAAAVTGTAHVWFVREFAFAEQGLLFPKGREAAFADAGRLSHRVIANSFVLRQELARFVDEDKLSVVYPPVDIDMVENLSFAAPAVSTGFTPGRLSIAVVGRITRSKGQWRVIEALGELASSEVDVNVCFVGTIVEPRADTTLLRRARSLGVRGSVVFTGEQANPFPYLRAADVSIVPTDIEAFGRVTLESLALGKPVITTREGAGAELVVPGVTGELFGAARIDELVNAIRRYVEDPARASRQEAAARERAAYLSSEEFGLAHAIRLLEEAVGADPQSVPLHWQSWIESALASPVVPRRRTAMWALRSRATRALTLGVRAIRDPRRAWRRIERALRRN
ncbi:glycosyltransferase [Chryseoglobus sp. 28M-23]|uniref:glycosyltransferase n=1 Tax=Chryseoglobus sp. 28M-23 TaxID=2772253 RepID=UPI0017467200|nr:glycosyltransferase [Chryseoglobus sp. 28M-23]QOD93243.1 glycosyltransferase [Chryseoglobus sp. 28M-23]